MDAVVGHRAQEGSGSWNPFGKSRISGCCRVTKHPVTPVSGCAACSKTSTPPRTRADAVTLVVDELVTNATLHAATRMQVTVGRKNGLYRCVVRDECTDGPYPRIIETADGYGRGLRVVALLSVSWGVERDSGGTSVWAEIDATGRA